MLEFPDITRFFYKEEPISFRDGDLPTKYRTPVSGVAMMGVNSIGDYNHVSVNTAGKLQAVLVEDAVNAIEFSLSDKMIDSIWEKMYNKPVIVLCPACNSGNATTNPCCISCGTPRGSGDWRPLSAIHNKK